MTYKKLEQAENLKNQIEKYNDAILLLSSLDYSNLSIEHIKFSNGQILDFSSDNNGGSIVMSDIARNLLKYYDEKLKILKNQFEQL